MNKQSLIFLLFLFCACALSAQEKSKKYWIYFKDKNTSMLSKNGDVVSLARSLGISERAVLRRAKVETGKLSEEDLPVSQSYIQQLGSVGIHIENTSRWFNGVTSYLTEQQVRTIASFLFIKEIEPVAVFKRRELPPTEAPPLNTLSKVTAVNRFLYGSSQTQMATINAIAVHNIRISGRGVLIGMLDTGFRWRTHEALKGMRVIKEYDFIQKDTITANDGIENASQDSHGTSTMSTVGGFKEDQLVSPSFSADFILAKTEDVPTEKHIEEDNWVAGIEWMEQNGVDVVSSSLGYNIFPDDPGSDYTYANLNGRIATTTKAAVIAMRKGVIVCNAMGNEGNSTWKYLITPADADSIISVGAVSSAGNIASFSSIGPTSDGRTKPDVVAQGTSVYCASPPNKSPATYTFAQGTSLSTPLVAGVAGMILSAHPELTPVQVRDALRNTANKNSTPNNSYGWGLIDAYKAVLYNGMVISTDPEITLTPDSNFMIGMYVVSNAGVNKSSVALYYSTMEAATFSSVQMVLTDTIDALTNSGKYTGVIPKQQTGAASKFYVRAVDGNKIARTSPYSAPVSYYDTKTGTLNVPHENVPISFRLNQNFPNPFNPNTVISYQLPVNSFVTLTVYDMIGREVATLVSKHQNIGTYKVSFNGSTLASGIYVYRLTTDKYSEVKKMILLK